jgi:acyl-coenzyme A thioesterase PaaI-like protein
MARESFARRAFMHHLGVELGDIAPGQCTLHFNSRPEFTQQNGFVRGGLVAALADAPGLGSLMTRR